MKTAALTNKALDWAIASIVGEDVTAKMYERGPYVFYSNDIGLRVSAHFSDSWCQAGPLIDKYDIALSHAFDGEFAAFMLDGSINAVGPTKLIAAMRCLAVKHYGEDIDVPQVLL